MQHWKRFLLLHTILKLQEQKQKTYAGVNSDGTIYKLLEYNLIANAGKSDAPGRPTTYEVTNEFMKMFGITSLEELPELPRYKLDENKQIVIDEIIEQKNSNEMAENIEAPMPEREEKEEKQN